MGFLDDAKKKVSAAVDKHGDKIDGGIDKAARFADEKTKGKHSDKIAGATSKVREGLDKLDGKDDDLRNGPGSGGPRPPRTDGPQ